MSTSKLGIPLLSAKQVLKYATINQAFNNLDITCHLSVINQGVNTPPGSPGNGDAHIVGSSPTGDWSGQALNLAWWFNGVWNFITRFKGMRVWDEAQNSKFIYNGTAWVQFGIGIHRTKQFIPNDFINESGAVQTQLSLTNFDLDSWVFTNGADDEISTQFFLPKHADYEDVNIKLFWTNTVTATGDVRWIINIYNHEEGESISGASSVSAQRTHAVDGNTANFLEVTTFGSGFNLQADVTEQSILIMKITSEGTHVDHTFDQDINLLAVNLEYKEKVDLDPEWS